MCVNNKWSNIRSILRDIKDITELSGNPEVIKETFMNGYCYEFAQMLKSWYPGGTIYFDPEASHYYYYHHEHYWDIRGENILNEKTIERLEEDK